MKAEITEITEKDRAFYGNWLPSLVEAQHIVLKELEIFEKIYYEDTGHEMAEHIKSRIKGGDSSLGKLKRLGLPMTADSAIENTTDYVGIRVVCGFVEDVFAIVDRLKGSQAMRLEKEKDYISHPKANGYRSFHAIFRVPVASGMEAAVEIQLRTIAQDCWASLEHQMKYKKEIAHEALLARELKRCADEMASTDLSMQTIRHLIEEDTL